MKNKFFDVDTCEFEVQFVEELTAFDKSSGYDFKYLGSRKLEGGPGRPVGSPGRIEIILTENITLNKGHKIVTVKASKKQPIKCYADIQVIYGPQKPKQP